MDGSQAARYATRAMTSLTLKKRLDQKVEAR
jgi:hypothetical protein